MISNAFACRNVGPAGEERVAALMADAVGKERKIRFGVTSGYAPGAFTGGAYDDARAAVLRMLADGPCVSADMREHVAIGKTAFNCLLGAMRSEGLIDADRRPRGTAYVWRLGRGEAQDGHSAASTEAVAAVSA